MLVPVHALIRVAVSEKAARFFGRPRRYHLEFSPGRNGQWLPWKSYSSLRAAQLVGRHLMRRNGFRDAWRVRRDMNEGRRP